jgi:drug/metabolite transporter (DMT)-like permease
MVYLVLVSLVWAFSFGLIKGNLAGLDSNFVSFCRMAVSLVVFLPFLKLRKVNFKLGWRLAVVGALQFGVMYITYIAAFKSLQAYEVALFTIFTPLYVVMIEDILQRKFHPIYLLTAIAAVGGTWIIKGQALLSPQILGGFVLVQISNICFALGQVWYRRIMAKEPAVKDHEVFGILYFGAAVLTAISTLVFVPVSSIVLTAKQAWTLLYLGAVASGISFFLWNLGARKVNAGALAIFNDLKIPLAVFVSLVVFGEKTNVANLLIGGSIMILALVVNEWVVKRQTIRPEAKAPLK